MGAITHDLRNKLSTLILFTYTSEDSFGDNEEMAKLRKEAEDSIMDVKIEMDKIDEKFNKTKEK